MIPRILALLLSATPLAAQDLSLPGLGPDLVCGDTPVQVVSMGETLRMRVAGVWWDLMPVPAASGARFESEYDAGTFLWSKGEGWTAGLFGRTLPPCAPAPEGAFVARGIEPFWRLTITDGTARFEPMDGPAQEGPLSEGHVEGGALVHWIDGTDLSVTLDPRLSRDAATGMPHPFLVTVSTGDTTMTGTGGDPATLLQGVDWRAEDVGGQPVPQGVTVTLRLQGGQATGHGGCNRFGGPYDLTGEGLRLGPLAATRMACPPPRMATETAVFDALSRVTRFDIDETGALVLIAGDAPVMRFRMDVPG